MKVAHICPRLKFPGGTEKFVVEVNSEMRTMGIESRIYSIDFNAGPALLSNLALSRLLANRAMKDGFESLIFHKGHAGSVGLRNVKTLCYFHQILPDDFIGKGFPQNVYKNFLVALDRQLTRIVCNSEYTASRLRVEIPKATIDVVYPGVRPAVYKEQLSSSQGFCYYHSRINPRKNQLFLVRVFEKLPYNLLLTGGTWDRQFRGYQESLAQEISRIPTIQIATNISEETYLSFLSESLLFCFPALYEPFGMTMLEAMTLSKPVIAVESGATPEVLAGAGVLCKPSIEEWRSTISQIVSDSSLRTSLSKRSIARAAEFSWEKTTKQLIEIIDNCEG